MPQYPIPKTEFMDRLRSNPLLGHPNQQQYLDQYAKGEIGVETTVARTLADIKARVPALEDERNAEAAERARRARVQREMALNETADGPTFVACDADGNPLDSTATSDGDESDEPGSGNADNTGTDHSNGDQEIDQDYDPDLNQERELDEFGDPLRDDDAEQSEWDV